MAIKKVSLTVSQIIEDLNNGLYWLKSEDTENTGSIETKYGITAEHVAGLRTHPKLAELAPADIIVIELKDDTVTEPVKEKRATTKQPVEKEPETPATAAPEEEDADLFAMPGTSAHEPIDLGSNTEVSDEEPGNFMDML